MRRMFITAIAVLTATAALTTGVATPAAAAGPTTNILAVSGTAFIADDEPWPKGDDTGTHTLSAKTLHLPSEETAEWIPCEGGEVRSYTRVRAYTYAGIPGRIAVGVRVVLYEGKNCKTRDVANYKDVTFDMAPNETVEKTIRVRSEEGASDDRTTVKLKLTNWYAG